MKELDVEQTNLAVSIKRHNSLRWRLPLSYAAIAGLTAAVLGAVLLAALLIVYETRERAFLEQNALLLRPVVADALARGEAEAVVAERALWAALNDMRIRILDQAGAVVADSGEPGPFLFAPDAPDPPPLPSLPEPPSPPIEPIRPILDLGGLYGLQPGLFRGPRDNSSPMPERQIVLPVTAGDGSLAGYLLLEGGPDDSRTIVAGVAVTWALAAAVAVIIAVLAGWFVSRQLSNCLKITSRFSRTDSVVPLRTNTMFFDR